MLLISSKTTRVFIGGLVFVLLIVYAVVNGYLTLRWLGSSSEPGWVEAQATDRVVVQRVKEGGPAAKLLRTGDQVIAINDKYIASSFLVFDLFQHLKPGTAYTVLITRNGVSHLLNLRTGRHSLVFDLGVVLAVIVVPLTCLYVGLWVFLGNPYNKQTLLIALALGMTIPEIPLFALLGNPFWIVAIMMLGRVATFLSFPLYLHFFLIFPKPPLVLDRFPRLEMLLYVLYTPIIYVTVKLTWLSALAPEQAFLYRTSWVGQSRYLIYGIYLLGAIASLIVSYVRSSELSRRRIRILAVGAVLGFLPLIFRFVAVTSSSPATIRLVIYRWPNLASFLFLLLVPLSFAYAIKKHRVLPIKLIIKRSIGYLIVYQGSVVLAALLVLGAVYIILHSLFSFMRWYMPLVAGIIIGVTSIGIARLAERLHQRIISPKIKKKFFRQTYQAEHILFELAEKLKTVVDIESIAQLVAEKVQQALHTSNVTFFLHDEATGDYLSAFSYDDSRDGLITRVDNLGLVLHKTDPIIQGLLKKEAHDVELTNRGLPIFRLLPDEFKSTEQTRASQEVLQSIRSDLLIPVATKEQLLGVVSLGPRLGDIPFSWRDKELLSTVAWQMAISLENAQLIKRKTEEAVLRRELAMGYEVQRRFVAECPDETQMLEFSGVSLPAHGVGGDYYDLFVFDGGLCELLIADVSGKGIPAALLMAFIKAVIHTFPVSPRRGLPEMVASLDRLLFRLTEANKFTTLFHAQLDEATLVLKYVNAGHESPILLRKTDSGVALKRLQSTGGLVGIIENSAFDHKEIQLLRGDILITYTDGVTDAENLLGERFQEERLLDIINECWNLSARQVQEKIMHAVAAWSDTAPQSDDITVVVVRVK